MNLAMPSARRSPFPIILFNFFKFMKFWCVFSDKPEEMKLQRFWPQRPSRKVKCGLASVLALVMTISLSDGEAKVKSRRQISSLSSSDGFPRVVNQKGEDHLLVSYPDSNGKHKSRLMISRNITDLRVDQNDDGWADIWEVSRGSTRVRASGLIRGRFARLEIEERAGKGGVQLEFLLRPDLQTYRLVAKSSMKNRLAHAEKPNDVVVGPVCADSEKSTHQFASEWAAHLQKMIKTSEVNRHDQLNCFITKYEKAIFDASCYNEPFASSLKDMKEGLQNLILSSLSDSPARYLQCLRDRNLQTHSARIESFLWQRIQDAQRAFEKAGKDVQENCSKPLVLTADVSRNMAFSRRPIKCEKAANKNWRASYNYDTQQVILRQPSAETAQAYGQGVRPADAYASTLFHELVHASQISDELMVSSAELCCSGLTTQTQKSCDRVRTLVDRQRIIQELEATLTTRDDRFSEVVRDANRSFPPEKATELLNGYYLHLNQADSDNDSAYQQCAAKSGASCDLACQESCLGAYRARIRAHTNDYFNAKCSNLRESSPPAYRQNINCDDLKNRMSIAVASNATPRLGGSQPPVDDTQFKPKLVGPAEDGSTAPSLEQPPGATQPPSLGSSDNPLLPENQAFVPPLFGTTVLSASEPDDLPSIGSSDDVPSGRLGNIGPERSDLAGYDGRSTVVVDKFVDKAEEVLRTVQKVVLPTANAASNWATRGGSSGGPSSQAMGPANEGPDVIVMNPFLGKPGPQVSRQSFNEQDDDDSGKVLPPNRVALQSTNTGRPSFISDSQLGTTNTPQIPSNNKNSLGLVASKISPQKQRIEIKSRDEVDTILRDYPRLKSEFSEPSFKSALIRYRIQIVDDQGKVHGSWDPRLRLEYCGSVRQLVPQGGCRAP
jgi:hypothetical protein